MLRFFFILVFLNMVFAQNFYEHEQNSKDINATQESSQKHIKIPTH